MVVGMSMSSSLCLSVYLSVCLLLYVSVCLCMPLSFSLSLCLWLSLSLSLSVCLSICRCYICLCLSASVFLSVCLCICLSVSLSLPLSVSRVVNSVLTTMCSSGGFIQQELRSRGLSYLPRFSPAAQESFQSRLFGGVEGVHSADGIACQLHQSIGSREDAGCGVRVTTVRNRETYKER